LLELTLIIKGLLAGLAIAVPVGPINVLCASRTLTKGRMAGILSGLGAAAADGVYGAVAGFSITLVIGFLEREEFWIRVIGGIALVGIGVVYFRKPPQSLKDQKTNGGSHSDFVSTFLLTLTNPTTVLSFMAVLTALGMGGHRAWWLTFLLVGGIFCGSMLWWIVLATLVNWLRDRFDDNSMRWMNRIAGVAIGGFGLFTFILGLTHKR
jgi:threonine/homoserine/homoserine lactone efflux protein